MKFYFHNKGDFLKSVRSMRRNGGPKQTAAEKVEEMIGRIEWNANCLASLPTERDDRINHAMKYSLPGGCLLVTAQGDDGVWFLFVGDLSDTEGWLEAHRGLQIAINQKKQIQPVLVSDPGSKERPSASMRITSDERPLLERISFPEFDQLVTDAALRSELKAVREETDDDEIQACIAKLDDFGVQSLIIDLLTHLRKGEMDEALTRIDVFFGRAANVIESPTILAEVLQSGENTELVTSLNSLSQSDRNRLFSDDFEPWLLWLHPDQQRAVDEDFDRPAVLKGVSGSGKTVILIHRARRLAQKYPDQTIGVLTLNRSLARLLENLIRKLCLNGEHERIKVQAFYDYFSSVLSHLGSADYLKEYIRDLPETDPMVIALTQALAIHQNLANEFSPQSGETLDDTWDEFWRIDEEEFRRTKEAVVEAIKGRGEYDVKAYLRDEFVLIRSAFARAKRGNATDGESYFNYRRSGRAIGLPEKTRQNILRMLRRYEEYMMAGGLMDELALSQALLPVRTKFSELPASLRHRCLLIDEFQDFSTLELTLLKRVPTQVENGFFLAGDMVQKVMVKDFNLGAALLDRNYTRTRTITKNYRNSRQILLAAHTLVKYYGEMATRQDQSIEVLDPELAIRETAAPIALKVKNPIDAAWDTAQEWVRDGGCQPWSVCVVTANEFEISPSKILEERPANLHADRLSGDHILNRHCMVVGTLSEVKGFEFSLIVIVGCEAGILPDPGIPREERWRDALRLYVAMTRGRDQVVMTYRDSPSEFLELMRSELVWKENPILFEGARSKDAAQSTLKERPKTTAPVRLPHMSEPVTRAKLADQALSADARYYLLTYFERNVFPKSAERNRGLSLQSAFEKWLRPINVNRTRVSQIFEKTEVRRDVAREIDEKLKRYGCALTWDC